MEDRLRTMQLEPRSGDDVVLICVRCIFPGGNRFSSCVKQKYSRVSKVTGHNIAILAGMVGSLYPVAVISCIIPHKCEI